MPAPSRSPGPAADLTQAGKLVSIAGGGDTVAAMNAAGVADRLTYVSTAGGAFLEWMEGKPLPGVESPENQIACRAKTRPFSLAGASR